MSRPKLKDEEKSILVSFRLPPDIARWLDNNSKRDKTKTRLVIEALIKTYKIKRGDN